MEEYPHRVTRGPEDIRNRHDMVTGVTEDIRNRHDMVTGVAEEIPNGHDMVTGVQGEIYYRPHTVTRGPEEIRNRPHMMTGIQEDFPYCSLGTSSGEKKKACSTSHPHCRTENTPAIIEANQILLALQQLASNSNSTNINNNMIKTSKLPESLTTTMPTFDGKSEKFELLKIISKRV